MLFRRPNFREYVMARLVTIAVLIYIIFSLLLYTFGSADQTIFVSISLLGFGFLIFIFAIYRGANRLEKELNIVNNYLVKIEKKDKIDYKAHFFTQEFEDINQNLIKILKDSKKREDEKQRYNAKLKLKNRQRADMISAIAHEFRNPIASIMGYAQTLEEDKEIPQPLQEKFLSKIYNNGVKIEDLLGRLVLWNKFESGEATLHKSSFDIYVMAQGLANALVDKYQGRVVHVEGASYMVEADKTLIDIVLKNLIENALKYSKDDVLVSVQQGHISVIDKGMGIEESEIAKVTKKFYRSGTQSWDNSMGLGLSIVKNILAMHHSKLEIESEIDKGSTFSFTI